MCVVKNSNQQTVVARRREEVRGDRREQEDRSQDKTGSACDNLHTLSDGEETESETERRLDEQGTCVTGWKTNNTKQ